ncbi:MAG TPA: glycosyltransferase, partial [Streptosporangiaceae bacterium]|nr:glycosyltransferase [Streptosporangiaceae bacterium]
QMTGMFGALLIAGLVAAPLCTVGLLTRARRPDRTSGAWPSARRFALAIVGTVVLGAIVAGVLRLLSESQGNIIAGTAGIIVGSLVWLPVTRRWTARAHLCWAASIFLFVIYLGFVLDWIFTSGLGIASTVGGLLLWACQVFAALLACAYLWEICDALGSERWGRRVTATTTLPAIGAGLPFVSLHVPAHNEPPDMVIETLRALARLDYPRYEIVVIDDNTDDESLWRPVQAWCARHAVKFAHLADWPGYKSGALNYALRQLTDPAAELIGVVDSDYQLDPGFLRRCAPLFADAWVGFVQAPQDYRGWRRSRYYRRLYYSYQYFFSVSQPSRNERDGAIFAGTMGLIRRVALDQLGGWDEWCITEDAELSLRLLRAGWHGLHVDQSWGKGVMPLTFEALKGQRYRWCFGGIQILRMHWRSLLPGKATRENRMTAGQRWAYFSGAVQWYGDLLSLVFFVFLLAGAANLATGGSALFIKLSTFLVATIPVLVALGLVRAVALLRRGTGASWRDALGAFFIWQSTSVAVARASVLGLFARKAAFLRTPKTSEQAKWHEAFRANWAETTLALLGIAGIAGALTRYDELAGPLLAALLFFPTIGLAAAPINSWAAQRAALPPDLVARRTSEWKRADRRGLGRSAATVGGLVTVLGAVAAAMALLLAPSPRHVQSPPLVVGQGGATTAPAPSPSFRPATPTPAHTATSTPVSTPSSPPTPTPSSTPSSTPTTPASTPPTSPASSPPDSPASSPPTSPARNQPAGLGG